MKWPILLAAMLSLWVFPGCPQAAQPVGGMAPPAGDTAVAEVPPSGADVISDAEPIDPKMDPRGIGGGKEGPLDADQTEEERIHISGDMLKGPPLEAKPFVDARLRYGTDSKILAKSPAASYVIHSKSATTALSFSVELNWDPALADVYWLALTDTFESKPQLRAVYVPPGPHQHLLYSDAEWVASADGSVVYTFSNLQVVEGGELRFFMKETKTADFHSGGLATLDSDDAAKPFPSETAATIYPVGSFLLKAVFFSPSPGPVLQSDGPLLPMKL